MNEPTEVLVGRSVRPYDNLDRRMACTLQDQWTPEMYARAVSDQQRGTCGTQGSTGIPTVSGDGIPTIGMQVWTGGDGKP
jgi:hypothetical protein